MRQVVANADDFGIDENRTSAILECFESGAVSRTTAMVNMAYFEDAVKRIRNAGRLNRMGLHLNLTEGKPLTAAMRECSYFCDASGEFTANFHRSKVSRFVLPHSLYDIIRNEIIAQVERFFDAGATLKHVDSHHHSHTDLSIAVLAFPILKRYGFKSMRLSRNFGCGIGGLKGLYKGLFNRCLCKSFSSTEFFGGFQDLRECWRGLDENASVEVMVHPMYGEPENLSLLLPLTDSGRSMIDDVAFYNRVCGGLR